MTLKEKIMNVLKRQYCLSRKCPRCRWEFKPQDSLSDEAVRLWEELKDLEE